MLISRRDFVVSTALAAALGLNARLAISPAFAQKTPDPAKRSSPTRSAPPKSPRIMTASGRSRTIPAFIANASVDDVKAAMVKAGLPADFVSIPFTVVVVRNGGKTILCDSGTGGQVQPTAGKLMANMKAAGIEPAKIDTILISHFHPDHIFGLMEKEHQQAGLPQCRDHRVGRGIQVLDRSGGDRSAAGSPQRPGAAHPGGVPDLEEHPSGVGRARGRAGHPFRQRARAYARPSRVPSGVGRGPADDLQRHRLCAGAGRRQSGLARPIRPGRARRPKPRAASCSTA